MADVKWIKIVTDMFNNRKIKQMRKLPEGDAIIVIWLQLLCLAGQTNCNGMVYFAKDIPYTDEMLATEFDRPINLIRLALSTFESFGMIEIIDDVLLVSNWEKYQSTDRLKQIKEQNRLRQQNFREKQKLLAESNVTVTLLSQQNNAIDIDKELDIDNNLPSENGKEGKKPPKAKKEFSKDDKEYLLASYLSRQISKRLEVPLKDEDTLQKWAYEFDKMVRLDKHDIDEMKDVLVYSQRDAFWQDNIMSAKKFRTQYLTLLAKSRKED